VISFRYSRLPIDRLETRRFAFSYPLGPSPELTASIRETGILTPLLVLEDAGRLHLFDGLRRLKAAVETGQDNIPAAVFTREDAPRLLQLWIESQKPHRRLNPFEMATLVKDGPEAFRCPCETFLRNLADASKGLPPTLLSSLPGILVLPEPLKREAARRGYGASFLVKVFKTYPTDLLTETARVLEAFSLSENQLDALLAWLDEIAKRDHRAPSEILKADPLPFILAHPKMPSAKKRDAFLKAVFTMRFPRRAALDAAVRETRQRIETTGNLRLLPPPNLMGDRFELRITFREGKELRDALRRLTAFEKDIETLTKLV